MDVSVWRGWSVRVCVCVCVDGYVCVSGVVCVVCVCGVGASASVCVRG